MNILLQQETCKQRVSLRVTRGAGKSDSQERNGTEPEVHGSDGIRGYGMQFVTQW